MADEDITVEYLIGDDETAAPAPVTSPAAAPRRGSRRVLVIGLLGVLAVAVVVGGLLVGPTPKKPVAEANPLPSEGTAERYLLDRSGLSGAVGGSLAGSPSTLSAIRNRVADLSTMNDHPLTSPADVLLLWAGDLGAGRYAVAVYRQSAGWSRVVLSGPAQVAPGKLAEAGWNDDQDGMATSFADATATFVTQDGGAGAAFVIAPTAGGVEIVHARQFLPGGGTTTAWRSLQKQGGAVWAGRLDPNEAYLSTFRTNDPDSDQYPDVVNQGDGHAAARAVATGALARSDAGAGAVECAADGARSPGTSLAEYPVLAIASHVAKGATVGAVILRSPAGGWIWGLCDVEDDASLGAAAYGQTENSGGGVTDQRWAGPAQAMAALSSRLMATHSEPPRWVVLAPEGADQVRIKGVTAPVHDRLAVVTVPKAGDGAVTAEALRGGHVIGRCRTSSSY